jgi:glutaredoxin-like protein
MIPARDQAAIRAHFERDLHSRVRIDLFTQRTTPIIIPGRPLCPLCEEAQVLVAELAALSQRLVLTVHDIHAEAKAAAALGIDKPPAIVLRGAGNRPLTFFGMPTGTGFSNFVDMIVEASEVSKGTNGLQPETAKQLKRLRDDVKLQVFVTPSCDHSPVVVRGALRIGLQNHHVRAEAIEITEFPDLIQRFQIEATPTIVIDDSLVLTGAMDEATLVDCLLRVVEGKPVDPAMVNTGASTPLALSQPQEVRLPGSGLIIPR